MDRRAAEEATVIMRESMKDLALAVVLLALGIAVEIVLAHTRSGAANESSVVGFATMPRLYGWILIALSLMLGAGSLVRAVKEAKGLVPAQHIPSQLRDPTILMRTVGTAVLVVCYVVALERFTFFAATAVFLGAMFVLYGRRPLWRVALVALLGAAALDVLFIQIIDLPLH